MTARELDLQILREHTGHDRVCDFGGNDLTEEVLDAMAALRELLTKKDSQ